MPNETEVVQIYYDLKDAPITFDAATFFATAVGTLRQKGYVNFDVNIVAGQYRESGNGEIAYTPDQKEWRLNNIVSRLPLLIAGVANVFVARSRRILLAPTRYPEGYGATNVTPPYQLADMIKAVAHGADVQVYSASPYSRTWAYSRLGSGKTIVMTVRGGEAGQGCDTPLDSWYKLYKHLVSSGYRVFVVPDQGDVLFQRQFTQYDWHAIPEAAVDLDLRLALHQECYATIAWGGDSGMLLWYSKAPFLMFGVLNKGATTTDSNYFTSNGIVVGQRLPFFLPQQQVDWTEASELSIPGMIERTDAFLASLSRTLP